jgi:hypothetical protein
MAVSSEHGNGPLGPVKARLISWHAVRLSAACSLRVLLCFRTNNKLPKATVANLWLDAPDNHKIVISNAVRYANVRVFIFIATGYAAPF